MPYTLNRKPNYMIEITASLDKETVDSTRDNITKQFRNRAQVPGFRRGKAPLNAVRSRFAAEITGELRDDLSGTLWREVMESETDIRPITEPRFTDLDFGEDGDFHFTAEMEIRPIFELGDVSEIELPAFSLEVIDTEIENELERLQNDHASWEPADDSEAEDGMLIEADLHGEMEESDDDPYDEEKASFVIGEGKVPPEINEALQGAKTGAEIVATKVFPEDDPEEKRRGKRVDYTIKVHSLKRKVLPPIDDDLAATLGLENLEELNDRIKTGLGQRKIGERREAFKRHVLDALQKDLDPAELPVSLVHATTQQDMQRFLYSLAMQGMDPEKLDLDWQEMEAKAEPGARIKVLDNLVIEQLCEEWDIEVPESDVDMHIRSEAQQMSIPPAEHKANLVKEGKLDSIRHAARLAATVDAMIERAGGDLTS